MPIKKNKKMNKTTRKHDNINEDENKSSLPSKPVLKSTQANKYRAFQSETPQNNYDYYDDLEAFSAHVETLDKGSSLTVFIDGIDQLRRDDRSLPSNHLVKRNPYYFLWLKKSEIVGRKVSGFNLVCREFWRLFQDRFKGSVLVDHSPEQDYIQNGELVLGFLNYENWKALQQKLIVKNRFKAKSEEIKRQEESKRIAIHVEETGDAEYAAEKYEEDRKEGVALQAQTEQVAGSFKEDISSIMKKLESGTALTDEEMEKAIELTGTEKDTLDIKY